MAYLVASDEGHGFRKEINLLTITTALPRFFAQHLGGRYQAEILKMDIETVQ